MKLGVSTKIKMEQIDCKVESSKPVIFDTHAHVSASAFDNDRDSVIERAEGAGVRFLEVGFDEESSSKSIVLAESIGMYCSLGIHPHDAERDEPLQRRWDSIKALALSSRRVKAIGEIGLDYFRNLSPRQSQMECFAMGLELARELRLPVILHQRDAHLDLISIVEGHRLDTSLIFHCFSQDITYARRCLDIGGYIGIGGPITYPANSHLRELMKYIPRDRLLVETDCPYLAPQGNRGKRNEPSYITEVVDLVAALLGCTFSEIAERTSQNGRRAFGITDEKW